MPLRVEIGPRDLRGGVVTLRDRLGGAREAAALPGASQAPSLPGASAGHAPSLPGASAESAPSLPGASEAAAPSAPPQRLLPAVRAALARVQAQLLRAARDRAAANTHAITQFEELRAHAAAAAARGGEDGEGGGEEMGGGRGARAPYAPPFRMFLAPWADDAAAEAAVRAQTRYTLRCFPDAEQARLLAGVGQAPARCFFSGRPATHMALWARAY